MISMAEDGIGEAYLFEVENDMLLRLMVLYLFVSTFVLYRV